MRLLQLDLWQESLMLIPLMTLGADLLKVETAGRQPLGEGYAVSCVELTSCAWMPGVWLPNISQSDPDYSPSRLHPRGMDVGCCVF